MNSISQLWDDICRIAQCYLHPTQTNTPHINPRQTGCYSTYLPWRDRRLSWPKWLVT